MKKLIFSVFLISILWGCSTTPPQTPQNIHTVTICNQIWMAKNLDVSTYRNGDPIPEVTDPTQWSNLTTGAWCYYDNDAANGPIYGKLYNWYAVNDPRGLAPTGFHVPSEPEWLTLETCLGGSSIAGGKMKEAGLAHWLSPNTGASNNSGFTGIPGGGRYSNSIFTFINKDGYWWSSTSRSSPNNSARYLLLFYDNAETYMNFAGETSGFSVRCIKN